MLGRSIEKKQKQGHGPREGSATKTPKIFQNPKIHENPKTIARRDTEKRPTLGGQMRVARRSCGKDSGNLPDPIKDTGKTLNRQVPSSYGADFSPL